MAISATAVWEVRSTGDDAAGGMFDPGTAAVSSDLAATGATGASPVVSSASYTFVAGDVGAYLYVKSGTNWTPGWYKIASVSAGAATLTGSVGTLATLSAGSWLVDYSQQDSAALSVADAVTNATTTVTSTTGGFRITFKGNGINVAGTIRQITAVGSSTSITVDALITTGTGQTAKVGGALASAGKAAGFVNNNVVWMKAGTYAVGNGTANTAGNRVDFAGNFQRWLGYGTVRGDGGRPTLQASAAGIGLLIGCTAARVNCVVQDIVVDGNGQSPTTGITASGGTRVFRCKAVNCSTGFSGNCHRCYAESCATGFSTALSVFCEAKSCSTAGFTTGNGSTLFCIAWLCGVGFNFNSGNTGGAQYCTAYGNTSHGFFFGSTQVQPAYGNIAYGNAGKGFSGTTETAEQFFANGAGANTGGTDNSPITLVADPFVNRAGGNFALNTTAGGGALLRGAGVPGAFPGGTTTGYPDVGAVQSQASAGGGLIGGGGLNGGFQ